MEEGSRGADRRTRTWKGWGWWRCRGADGSRLSSLRASESSRPRVLLRLLLLPLV